MNFFQHQDDARRKSAQLVFLMAAAVTALIFITTIAMAIFLYYFENHATSIHAHQAYQQSLGQHILSVITSEKMLWIALGVTVVVALGSFYKTWELKRGGDYVARSLGGNILQLDGAKPRERMLLNVVEEMAIASGMPVPRVYIIEETGINAFAAGTDSSNAVVGITRGCIETLNRAQLQGVIAHEFSHIHHGDMRLNMRLISVLHGILVIGLIGEFLTRGSSHRSYRTSRNKKGNQGAILGLALMAIGFTGVMFGNMIKAAVSRQREYLADASAVQYTRNPEGIAAALIKIKQRTDGSHLSAKNASEFSHFFFANGVSSFFSKIFSTHPSLDDRISRVLPRGLEQLNEKIAAESNTQADAKFGSEEPEKEEFKDSQSRIQANEGADPFSMTDNDTSSDHSTKHAVASPSDIGNTTKMDIDALLLSIGQVEASALPYAQAMIAAVPPLLYKACHSPYQARAVAYALLLETKDKEIRQQQVTLLSSRAHPATYTEFIKIHELVKTLDRRLHFPVLQLIQPSLLLMSAPQRALFEENLHALAEIDKKISLREWSVLTYLIKPSNHIGDNATSNSSKSAKLKPDSRDLGALKSEVRTLLGFACRLNDSRYQQSSLDTAIASLWPELKVPVPKTVKLKELDRALAGIMQLRALQKPKIMKALTLCMHHDGHMSLHELEVLRAIGAVLDCPIPVQP